MSRLQVKQPCRRWVGEIVDLISVETPVRDLSTGRKHCEWSGHGRTEASFFERADQTLELREKGAVFFITSAFDRRDARVLDYPDVSCTKRMWGGALSVREVSAGSA